MVKVAQVGRAQNRHADSLATLASSMTEEVPRIIKVELIREPSISMADNAITVGVDVAMISATRSCWMDPIIDFLVEDQVPSSGFLVLSVPRSQVISEVYWRTIPFMLTPQESK